MTRFWLLILTLCACCGCSDNAIPENTLRSAQEAFDQAQTEISAGNHAAALPLVDQAITGSGLNPDMYATALLLRAQCYAATQEVEKAQADLTTAEQGSPDMGLYHFTKGMILEASGDAAGAKREFAQAKRLNPSLKR